MSVVATAPAAQAQALRAPARQQHLDVLDVAHAILTIASGASAQVASAGLSA